MGDVAFYWIGVGVVVTLIALVALYLIARIYFAVIHGRFEIICFRRTERRLSLAAWYETRLMSDEYYCADDFPISRRPFLLSYRYGKNRLFIMAGVLEDRRHSPIKGKHPEYSA